MSERQTSLSGGRPWWRVALALIGAALLLAALLSGLAFLAFGSNFSSRVTVMKETQRAASIFFIVLPAFSLTFGLATMAILARLGRQGYLHWLVAGVLAGLVAATAQGVLVAGGAGIEPLTLAIAAALSAVLFLLIRLCLGPGRA